MFGAYGIGQGEIGIFTILKHSGVGMFFFVALIVVVFFFQEKKEYSTYPTQGKSYLANREFTN